MKKRSKNYEEKYKRIKNNLIIFMKHNGINFSNITIQDIEKFIMNDFRSINRSAYYQQIGCLNDILSENKVDIIINSKLYVDMCVEVSDKQYLNLDDMKILCNVLMNASDKFICYGLFKGIYGNNYSDLLEITTDMISEDKSYIELPSGKKFICDEYMQEILKDCLKEDVYYKYVSSSDLRSNDYYELAKSKYIIKPMPTRKNNNGYDTLSPSTLQRKFDKFANIFKDKTGKDILLSGTSLKKSGILYNMNCEEIKTGREWTVESVNSYLKRHGIESNKNEIHYIYHKLYPNLNKNQSFQQIKLLSKEIIKAVNNGELKEPLTVNSILSFCNNKDFYYSKSTITTTLSNGKIDELNSETSKEYFKKINTDEYIILFQYRNILFEEEIEKSKQDSSEKRNQRLSKIENTKPDIYITTMPRFKRNPDVAAEVLLRAKGKCEECKNKAPFIKKSNNTPYLEVHHIISLSDGGDDTVANCIAVCPNCHRKLHFG